MFKEFVEKALYQASKHSIYIWGGQGEVVKDLTLEQIMKMETNTSNEMRVCQLINLYDNCGWLTKQTRAFDCSGLVCWLLVKVGREADGFDMTANSLAKRYPQTKVLKPGVLVYRNGHIGIYVGYNHLIEAKGRDYGVVLSPFVAHEWSSTFADPFANER